MPPTPRRALDAATLAAALLLASAAVAVQTVGAQDVPPVPTRWPYPIVVTGTALALTERAAFYGTYAAWWTQTPAAPWPWVTATVGATATIRPTNDATITPTATPVLWPCRFAPSRCGTRAFIAYAGRGRRR